MIVLAIIIIVVLIASLIAASFIMSWGLFLKSYCGERLENSKEVMLTFDDGPHPGHTKEVLDVLKERGVRALFFLIGERALEYPEIVKRISDDGHIIGVHSLRHTPEFTILSAKMVKKDLEASIKILEDLSGQRVTLFRPPYGVTNPSIGKAVKELNLKSIGWNVRSFDTMYESDTVRSLKRVTKRVSGGSIILLHDRLKNSAGLLEKLLDYLEENGYYAKIFSKVL